ncbi:DUF1444 domain-containing protein [Bacillus sp. FJAT-45350]|uniref:DUF1444 domain-containing protein n=1 Tax=Bacillus sp. FJAT-45350 TaxID=2011014 RepID=UPI000BB95CEB|nr:DUF1444 domain-containing protein [Bacillus sp. FJAT-45350]
MSIIQLRKIVQERLERPEWSIRYNKEEEKIRIEDNETKKGVSLALKPLLAKYEKRKEEAVTEIVHYVESAIAAMAQEHNLSGNEKRIFPVIRSTSFPTETTSGKKLFYEEHTAETRIYYCLDLGSTYVLIDEDMVEKANLTSNKVKEMALFNIRSLQSQPKEDTVAGNKFYFVNSNDGYDASRILDNSLLERMNKSKEGVLAVAVPHQDVLIFADIVNDTGYDVLGQMVFQFYSQGKIPITALPFIYENGELDPTFILAQRKPKN